MWCQESPSGGASGEKHICSAWHRKVLRPLKELYSEAKMRGSVSGTDGVAAQALVAVGAALRWQPLAAHCELLLMLGGVAGREGTWNEGCHCHEFVLDEVAGEPSRKRRRTFAEASEHCWWRGRRAVEWALGHVDVVTSHVRDARSTQFTKALAELRAHELVSEVLQHEQTLKATLSDLMANKQSHWKLLPYRFLGIFGHSLNLCSLQRSQEVCRGCFDEVAAQVACDGGRSLHRVIQRLFVGSENEIRTQLLAFMAGDRPLRYYTAAYLEVRSYAMIPVVSRIVEGVHALVNKHGRRCCRFHPSLASALLRRPQASRLLEDPVFVRWAAGEWRRRCFVPRLLRFPLGLQNQERTRLMPYKTAVQRLYLCDVASQFREVHLVPTEELAWHRARASQVVGKEVVPAMDKTLSQCLKDFLSEAQDQLWSVPRGFIDSVADVPVREQRPVYETLGTLLVATQALEAPEPTDDLEFFMVTLVNPSGKSLIRADHIPFVETEVRVVVGNVEGEAPRIVSFANSRPGVLNLRRLDALPPAPSLFAWKVSRQPSRLRLQRPVSDAVTSALGRAGFNAEVRKHSDAFFRWLVARGFTVESGTWKPITEVDMLPLPEVLHILVCAGVVAVRAGEFESEVAARFEPFEWRSSLALDVAMPWYKLTFSADEWHGAGKFGLIVVLFQHRWATRLHKAIGYARGDEKVFPLYMVLRSANYFRCLLLAEKIWQAGESIILENMADGYYQCLLSLPQLTGFRDMPRFRDLASVKTLR